MAAAAAAEAREGALGWRTCRRAHQAHRLSTAGSRCSPETSSSCTAFALENRLKSSSAAAPARSGERGMVCDRSACSVAMDTNSERQERPFHGSAAAAHEAAASRYGRRRSQRSTQPLLSGARHASQHAAAGETLLGQMAGGCGWRRPPLTSPAPAPGRPAQRPVLQLTRAHWPSASFASPSPQFQFPAPSARKQSLQGMQHALYLWPRRHGWGSQACWRRVRTDAT